MAPFTPTVGRNETRSISSPLLRALTIEEHLLLRYGLALILLSIGSMKFSSYEAHGIVGLEEHSSLMRPLLAALGVQGISDILGVTEIATALLLIAGRFCPRVGMGASLISTLMFLTTLTFLVTTPGREPSLGRFPALSGAVGQFLIKDVVLLGAAVYTARESLTLFVSQQPEESAIGSRPAVLMNGGEATPSTLISSSSALAKAQSWHHGSSPAKVSVWL